jgi:YVTN family beta-propeller protein
VSRVCIVLLFAVVSAGMGQWLEATIGVPDTLGYLEAPDAIACNPLTERVYIASNPGVLVFDPISREKQRFFAGSYNDIAMCPDGGKAFLLDWYGLSMVPVDANADTLLEPIDLNGIPRDFAYSPISNKLYVVVDYPAGPDSLLAFDVSADTLVSALLPSSSLRGLEWDSAGDRLFVGIESDSVVKVLDCATDSVVGEVRLTMQPWHLSLSQSARKLYCAGSADYIQVADADSLVVLRTIPGVQRPDQIAWSSAAGRIYCRRRTGTELTIIDCARDSIRAQIDLPRPLDMKLSQESDRAYLCCDGNDSIAVVDSTDQVVRWIPAVPFEFQAMIDPVLLGYMGSRQELYCAADQDLIELVDAASDTVAGCMDYTQFEVYGMAYSESSGKLYALSPLQQTLHVIDSTHRVIANLGMGTNDRDAFLLPVPEVNRVFVADEYWLWAVDCSGHTVVDSVPLASIEDAILVFHPPTHRLVAFPENALGDEYIWTYDCLGDSLVGSVAAENEVPCAEFCAANGMVYFGSTRAPAVRVFDPGTGQIVDTVSAGPNSLNSRMLVPDGDSVVYFTNDGDSRLYVIDAGTNTVRRSVSTEWDVDTMFYNPRLRKAYLCREALDDNIHVFDCRTETIVRTLSVDYRYIGVMNLLNDKLYLGGRDNPVVNVLHCPSDSVIEVLEGPGGFVRSMAWNRTDNRVYVGREDRILVYRDFMTGVASDRRPFFGPWSQATVVHRMQPLSVSRAGVLLDVTGRKVMELAPGKNDVSGLAPSAYFIRRKQDGTTSRVVLLR